MTKVTWELELEEADALSSLLFSLFKNGVVHADIDGGESDAVPALTNDEVMTLVCAWSERLTELLEPHEVEINALFKARLTRLFGAEAVANS